MAGSAAQQTHDTQLASYAASAITNPTVPLSCPINNIEYGTLVMIDGFTLQKGNRFNISLDYESVEKRVDDALLYLAVRFDEKCIVRQSRQHNDWTAPERAGGLAGLKQGAPFECFILVKEDCFKIAFSKKHLADYQHKSPPTNINRMRIDGAVRINSISFQRCLLQTKQTVCKAMPPLLLSGKDGDIDVNVKKQEAPLTIYGPAVPVARSIPGHMKPGRVFYISGKVVRYSKGFQVDFKVGSATGHGNIALHFRAHRQQKAIWCNAQIGGKWGSDDPKLSDMADLYPFKVGTHFDLVVLCQEDKYKISVNNRHLMEFKHRIKELDTIRGMLISEGVSINQVRIA